MSIWMAIMLLAELTEKKFVLILASIVVVLAIILTIIYFIKEWNEEV